MEDVTDPAAFARSQLVRLRAELVRLSHEVEGAADGVSGKRAAAARDNLSRLARRMRDVAMREDMIRASRR